MLRKFRTHAVLKISHAKHMHAITKQEKIIGRQKRLKPVVLQPQSVVHV